MSPEDIARKYEEFAGHELIDYAEVGLPVFRLVLDVVTIERRPIGTIVEFVLRAVGAQLQTSADVAGFLGLDLAIVDAVIRQAVQDGFLTPEPNDELIFAYVLTEQGNRVLREAGEYRPQEETITIDYDGLLAKPIWLGGEPLSQSQHLALRNQIEIHPYPADPPKADQLKIAEVRTVLGEALRGRARIDFDILALKRVTRVIRLFRPAVGLAYRMKRTRDLRISFVVDGAHDEELDRAFAEKQGPRHMRISTAVDESDLRQKIRRRLGRDITGQLPSEDEVRMVRQRLATSKFRVEVATQRLARADLSTSRVEVEATLREAQQQFESSRKELQAQAARELAAFEHDEMFDYGLHSAKSRLWISSASLRDSFLHRRRQQRLGALLSRGVSVKISLDVDPGTGARSRYEQGAFTSVRDLQRRFSNLIIERRPAGDGLYFLLVDDKLAVVTNRPFLSNLRTAPNFMTYYGVAIQRPELVAPLYNRFGSALVDG